MDPATAKRLIELNKQFYQTFSREFSSTRQRIQPGVRRIMERLKGDESILDLGCGNGEFARQLVRQGHRGQYVGLDFSLPLLDATNGLPDGFSFHPADLTSTGWVRQLPPAQWNLVTAFAVLHHIPGHDLRLDIAKKIHSLLEPIGLFIHSEWQFLSSEKLKSRIQPWSEIGLSAIDVDAGDYLLDWRQGGRGLRYVHSFDEAELNELAMGGDFRVGETFYSDGQNGRLGLYQVWEAKK